jgi:hypothetical protein
MSTEARRKAAIRLLEKAAAIWPRDDLWVFAADSRLCVMRYGPDGRRLIGLDRGMDQDAIVARIDIPADGGDW